MRPELLALYGGHDQIMGITSGLATLVGIFFMFWNKVLVIFGKIVNRFRSPANADEPPQENQ